MGSHPRHRPQFDALEAAVNEYNADVFDILLETGINVEAGHEARTPVAPPRGRITA